GIAGLFEGGFDVAEETAPESVWPPLTQRLARLTVYGTGGATMAGVLAAGLLYGQAALARRSIPQAQSPPPRRDGRYGLEHPGPEIRLSVLGDSSAAGYGVERARDTTGALLAAGIAERLHRPVNLRSHAVVGALSVRLGPQVARAVEHRPDLA